MTNVKCVILLRVTVSVRVTRGPITGLDQTFKHYPAGFSLLKLIRSYLELDMFTSLTLQMESTLEIGRQELLYFEELVAVRA